MTGFEIVDMTEAHLAEAVPIWVTGWTQGHAAVVPQELIALRTPESFRKRFEALVPNTRILIHEGAIVGFCMIRDAEVYQMYVSKAAQGTGTAQALMGDAEAKIATDGHKVAWLDCAVGNARAARFYEKCGWVNSGIKSVDLDTLGDPFALEIWRYEKSLA